MILLEYVKISMRKFGALPQHALLVTRKVDGTYKLEDGNHRLEAVTELSIAEVPVHISLKGQVALSYVKRFLPQHEKLYIILLLHCYLDNEVLKRYS